MGTDSKEPHIVIGVDNPSSGNLWVRIPDTSTSWCTVATSSYDVLDEDAHYGKDVIDTFEEQIKADPFYETCLRGKCGHCVTRAILGENQILVKCQYHSGWMLPGSYSVSSFEPPEDCPLYNERMILWINHKSNKGNNDNAN